MSTCRPLIMQMHYNNAGDNATDSTTVNLKIEEDVERPLFAWFYVNGNIQIPPNQEEHIETVSYKIGNYFGQGNPMELVSIAPHMHKLGKSEKATLRHANGDTTCLIDVPRWDFNWQLAYTFEEPIYLDPTDRLQMECVYDSTGVDQTTYWGDGTNDEMCLLTMFTTFVQ